MIIFNQFVFKVCFDRVYEIARFIVKRIERKSHIVAYRVMKIETQIGLKMERIIGAMSKNKVIPPGIPSTKRQYL
jgi:hypothetical protein